MEWIWAGLGNNQSRTLTNLPEGTYTCTIVVDP